MLLGLGGFGAGVARRIKGEREQALRLVGGDALADDLRMVVAEAELLPEGVAAEVLAAAREVLGHARVIQAREQSDSEGITRLHILVFADLAEEAVREGLASTLAATEKLLLGHLGPIFESYRTGVDRGAAIVPLLTMPHPPAHAEGEAIVTCLKGLIRSVAATPAERRALPQIFVVEDVAERSILGAGELAQCLRNFASLLLYAGDLQLVSSLIHGGAAGAQPDEPLATFVCATAELPRSRLAAYGTQRVALEVLAAVRAAPRIDANMLELDAIEGLEVAEFSRAGEADSDVAEVLKRYAPDRSRDPPPPWWREGSAILDRYGPDERDRSLDVAQPPADPPGVWVGERMRAIQETWRLLQRRRFDDLVARDRTAVEAWRDGLLEDLRARVDHTLWQRPSPESFRAAEVLVAQLQRAFGDQLEQAVAARDASIPVKAPSFDALQRAHAELLDAARQKPGVALTGFWGTLALVGCVLFGGPMLSLLAVALGVDRGTTLGFLLLGHPTWTALVLGLLIVVGICGFHLARAHIAILRALDGLWSQLEQTITGPRNSLHDYFASRLRLARNIARVEVLLAVQAALADDAESLLLVDKAARRAQAILGEQQRQLGVRRVDGEDDLSGLLGRQDEALIESLVGPEGAIEIRDTLQKSDQQRRIDDVLTALADHYKRGDLWREEVPFADIDRLKAAAARHAEPIATWDPFADAGRSEATAKHLAGFLRRQRRTLRTALNFTGHEVHDPTGISRAPSGEAILPKSGHQLVDQALQDEYSQMSTSSGCELDRAYYLLVAGGIHEDAVASLRIEATSERGGGSALNPAVMQAPRSSSGSAPKPGGKAAPRSSSGSASKPGGKAAPRSSSGSASNLGGKAAPRSSSGSAPNPGVTPPPPGSDPVPRSGVKASLWGALPGAGSSKITPEGDDA